MLQKLVDVQFILDFGHGHDCLVINAFQNIKNYKIKNIISEEY